MKTTIFLILLFIPASTDRETPTVNQQVTSNKEYINECNYNTYKEKENKSNQRLTSNQPTAIQQAQAIRTDLQYIKTHINDQ